MPHCAAALLLMLGGVLASAPAAAQGAPAPPGPYVADVRGASSGLPQDAGFFPAGAAGTLVPSRGNGFDVGVHVYRGRLRGASLGFGASFLNVRGRTDPQGATSSTMPSTAPSRQAGMQMELRTVAPQVSFNFGTVDGWSYLSGGVGTTRVSARPLDVIGARPQTTSMLTINGGAGARWFLKRHIAVGFDARLHRLGKGSTTPASMLFSISAGISLR